MTGFGVNDDSGIIILSRRKNRGKPLHLLIIVIVLAALCLGGYFLLF